MFIDPNLQGQPGGDDNGAADNAAGTQEGAIESTNETTTDAGQAGEGE